MLATLSDVDHWIIAAGAAITVMSGGLCGLRVHRLTLRYAPSVATVLPRPVCIIAGYAIGIAAVALWVIR